MSIITPTYNREAYLAQAIESVLSQDFTEWELIIVDDGSSTNASRLLADAYCRRDSRISFHERPHGGASAARNYGIARARGAYLAFLDSDDRYLPGGLSRLRLARSRQVDHGREQFIRRLEAELPRILGARHGSGARIAKE